MEEENLSKKDLFKAYWKHDLIAAISVSLVALPLGMGIAIASNAPPISGLIAAIVGGILTTFIRGSHVAINGPGAGIIVVILSGNELLADDGNSGFPYVLAAICMAGVLQMILGLLKLGRLGELVPNGVVQGMLAAIGIIIMVKQAHIGLGTVSQADTAMGSVLELPKSILNLDPKITLVTLLSLGIMIIYPRVNNKLFHFLPAPVWVLIFAIPFVFFYQHIVEDLLELTNPSILFPDSQLIDLPADLMNGIIQPNFSKIDTGAFWLVVISVMIMSSIETLISSKAVDDIDPLKRKTNLNKDLMAVGLSTGVSGLLGGLPVITVIVRSSVNISNNGKTGLSNFFHGVILLVFLLALKPVVEEVPLAALAAILMYTGFRLASPKQFADAYEKGEEQLLVMVFTVITVLIYGLLWGIGLGIGMTFLVQWIKSRMTLKAFTIAIFSPGIKAVQHEFEYELKLNGVFNFMNQLKLKAAIKNIPQLEKVKINFEDAILLDFTIMEYLGNYAKAYIKKGGTWIEVGLDHHEVTSSHPFSMRMLQPQYQHSARWMTEHQRDMMKISAECGWQFTIGKDFRTDHIASFAIFKTHPIEYVHNVVTGLLPKHNLYFNLQDIVFDEGAFFGKIAYDTTAVTVELKIDIPEFVLEKEELFDRLAAPSRLNDINFDEDKAFSEQRLLCSENETWIRNHFTQAFRTFILDNPPIHVESCGNKLLFFNRTSRLSRSEMDELVKFSVEFVGMMNNPI